MANVALGKFLTQGYQENGKAISGIGTQRTAVGTKLLFGTSNNVQQGITNQGIILDEHGNVIMSNTPRALTPPTTETPAQNTDYVVTKEYLREHYQNIATAYPTDVNWNTLVDGGEYTRWVWGNAPAVNNPAINQYCSVTVVRNGNNILQFAFPAQFDASVYPKFRQSVNGGTSWSEWDGFARKSDVTAAINQIVPVQIFVGTGTAFRCVTTAPSTKMVIDYSFTCLTISEGDNYATATVLQNGQQFATIQDRLYAFKTGGSGHGWNFTVFMREYGSYTVNFAAGTVIDVNTVLSVNSWNGRAPRVMVKVTLL